MYDRQGIRVERISQNEVDALIEEARPLAVIDRAGRDVSDAVVRARRIAPNMPVEVRVGLQVSKSLAEYFREASVIRPNPITEPELPLLLGLPTGGAVETIFGAPIFLDLSIEGFVVGEPKDG